VGIDIFGHAAQPTTVAFYLWPKPYFPHAAWRSKRADPYNTLPLPPNTPILAITLTLHKHRGKEWWMLRWLVNLLKWRSKDQEVADWIKQQKKAEKKG
jgi:hypothetical protein